MVSLDRFKQNLAKGIGLGPDEDVKEPIKDCLECRIVGGVGCIGIGSYVAYQARMMKGKGTGIILAFAGCFIALGTARLTSGLIGKPLWFGSDIREQPISPDNNERTV